MPDYEDTVIHSKHSTVLANHKNRVISCFNTPTSVNMRDSFRLLISRFQVQVLVGAPAISST